MIDYSLETWYRDRTPVRKADVFVPAHWVDYDDGCAGWHVPFIEVYDGTVNEMTALIVTFRRPPSIEVVADYLFPGDVWCVVPTDDAPYALIVAPEIQEAA